MFKKVVKSKSNHHNGSHESVDSSGNMSGSSTEKEAKDGKDKIMNLKNSFNAYFLGIVPDINMSNSTNRDSEAQLIDQLEEAQIEGALPITAKDEDKVIISISRRGIKVSTTEQEVLQRHSLQTIAQLVHYDDGFGKHNVALKKGQVTKSIFQCYVFQCISEVQAQEICQCIRRLFDHTVDDIGRFQPKYDV
ncbi:hypothetical protein ScPMuIL_006433 [Solemya velum]